MTWNLEQHVEKMKRQGKKEKDQIIPDKLKKQLNKESPPVLYMQAF